MYKIPCVYILASKPNGVLYVGVTTDLVGRVGVHKQDLVQGFTSKYSVYVLVYYEVHKTMEDAIRREKQLKKWNRAWKIRLIEQVNPEWADLWHPDGGGAVREYGVGGQVLPEPRDGMP
jgi:putative endonuclease